MAERDPFGRLPDENPLAGLGSLSDGTDSQSESEPVAARWEAFEEVAAAEPAAQAQAAQRERPLTAASSGPAAEGRREAAQAANLDPAHVAAMVRRVFRIVRISVTIAIVVAIGLVVLGVAVSEDEEPTSGQFAPERIPALPAPPPPSRERPSAAPVGLQARSLMTRRNVASAMRGLATSGLGRLRTLRVAPARIDVTLLTRGGKLRVVQVTPDGRRRTLSLSGAGFGGLPALKFADVSTSAPERMARAAAERLKRPVSRVDYVALVGAGPQAMWTVLFRGGGQFTGDSRGRITRRIG